MYIGGSPRVHSRGSPRVCVCVYSRGSPRVDVYLRLAACLAHVFVLVAFLAQVFILVAYKCFPYDV